MSSDEFNALTARLIDLDKQANAIALAMQLHIAKIQAYTALLMRLGTDPAVVREVEDALGIGKAVES